MIGRIFQRHPEPRRGQTIVLFALMSLVLIAGLGLVIDAGVDYAQRRIMQNAADLAALAGARAISQQVTVTPRIRQVVEDAAVANGVPASALSAPDFCQFINNSQSVIGSCNNNALSAAVTGVRVRVAETHTTYFMRAIGINTSGTAASSMAEVQITTTMLSSDVLMAVCGIETATTSGGKYSILTDSLQDDEFAPVPSPGSPRPQILKATDPIATIKGGAYSYDWNSRDASTGAFPSPAATAPEFIIQGPNTAKCRKPATWDGLIQVDADNNPIVIDRGEDSFYSFALTWQTSDLPNGNSSPAPGAVCPTVRSGPCRTINGPQGCVKWQNPDSGCIMLLPITDNYRANGTDSKDLQVYARAWGAFLVTKVGSEYRGRMIKNYPMHADSTKRKAWDKTYNGPISITLVKLN